MSGDPDSISEQAERLLAAGLDGLIVNMPDAQDLEPVRIAGDALSRVAAVAR